MEADEFYIEKTKISIGFILMVLACGLVIGKLLLFESSKKEKYPKSTSEKVVALFHCEAYCEDTVPMELLATDFIKPNLCY